ncbi:biopolymer transporter ExbD [Maritimibacter sp. 55A14]|uniref:ExbD/TolR family protein n=1 Tax=Maritimibacter sp. 55A14 TaxID=2174844 RepID=UPI000D60E3AA|nr:biopolymer transporter ExbD [Maritimibacter sp. 55A14]PWE33364.1 biopolymer transporter ExbD [Maritimibacter sp. 55A14]
MIRRGKHRSLARAAGPVDDDARIMPLINVVFLLLVFFMVAGQLAASDPFEVEPSASAAAPEAEREGAEVLMGAGGRLALDGRETAEAALLADLAERMAAAPEMPLRLRADGQVPASDLVAMMRRLQSAGAADITLIMRPRKP